MGSTNMINNLALTRKYWLTVIKRAWKAAWVETDARGWIIGLVIATGAAGLVSVLGFSNSVPENTTWIGDIINNFWVELLTTIAALAVVVSAFAFALLYIPAKIYDEQGGFVENPFRLVPVLRDDEIKSGQQVWASVKVWNGDKREEITDCFLRLDNVIEPNTGESLLHHEQRLTWSSREHNPAQSGNQPIVVTANDFRVCDIAKTISSESKAEFTMCSGGLTIPLGDYKLKLKVFGSWRGHQINYDYVFTLRYEGENRLRLEGPIEQ